MNINWARMNQEDVQRRWEEAVRHIEFCACVYKLQIKHGRYFLHEHPHGATSWQLPAIQELLKTSGVIKTRAHMCKFGMTSRDEWGEGLVYKPTAFATNSPRIAE
eukprot:241268-Karenia_brevis.AAC.1